MPWSFGSIRRLLLYFLTCAASHAAASILVEDQAALLTNEQSDRIAVQHGYLLKDFDIDYRVITVRNANDIVVFGARRFKSLNVGSLSKSSRGLLLIIDAAQDRVRLEVGHALESVYTDAFIAYIEQRQMVPFFQAHRVANGILATTELIVQKAKAAIAQNRLTLTPGISGSGGAGATTAARIGQPTSPHRDQDYPAVTAGTSPTATLLAYFTAMRSYDSRPQLDLYTTETQALLKKWVVTRAQMDSVLRTYRRCHPETAKIDAAGQYAVIRYPASQRVCSPWFFVREREKWRLDLAVMQRSIRFGRDNSWRFGGKVPTRFAFAFRDWKFDRHGFPLGR